MNQQSVNKIIRSFFGKHFSKRSHRVFGQWLRAEDLDNEKEHVIEELWEESPSVCSSKTLEDWLDLQQRITSSVPQKKRFHIHSWQKYVAVILLVIITGMVTYFLTNKTTLIQNPEFVEFFVPYGESQYVKLADGTEILVNAGSLLIYPEEFTGKNRTVFLSGEATLTVTPDAEKPFFVKTQHIDIQVLGTVFTIKSYPNDLYTSTTLETGSISVGIKSNPSDRLILKPSEQLIYSHTDHKVSIQTVDIDLYRMERKGYLIFEDVSFRELVITLERKYNVVIHYDAQQYKDYKYNVKFAPDESIEDVMNVLSQLIGITYRINKDVIFIN